MKVVLAFLHCSIFIFFFHFTTAQETDVWQKDKFTGLEFRSIGPAFMSGRIADIAIHPQDDNRWYVAVGSGGLWETKNAGVSWTPLFDDQPVYSLGCVTIDPSTPSTIWLGSGENVGGRHVGWGNGIYKSPDGGITWHHMGLKQSEHISKILVHPHDSKTIWVAAQGPLWSAGGERGVYKSTDGGKTWRRTLGDDKWTGATDILIDPRNPERLYAATWDRHRTVAAYMGGGPGTGIYMSTNGGESWTELTQGLPESNMGKIGLAMSPQKPDVLYAAIELDRRKGGVWRSSDRGASWTKMSDAVSGATGPHYYQELYACPHEFDRLYLVDVRMQISEDGGKTFRRMNEEHKHSDNHAIAFRQNDPDYLLVGTDGGLYESFDLAKNWRFINNMPITQFYKLAVDDAEPFYNVYGGTQDNSTEGGPSRTDNYHGIQNSDWRVVLNWDGHQPATEPGNPDILYGQRQEGTLSRIDRKTGEVIDIQPQGDKDDPYERYNWDAPILISPHDPKQVYFASQRLWKSTNRGDSWTALSGDLTRNENRIELPILGRQQSYDNAWDLYAMSNYNTITSISESPVQRDLLYIGTDDGLLQISEDGGDNWTKKDLSSIAGVPQRAYVNDIKADLKDADVVYMALDNHKAGDFTPYLFKSTNKGKTWRSITDGLPENTIVWRIVQDDINPNLLFIGTEFGVYFSPNGGNKWIQLKGGLPTISFRDLTIQRREGDLVCASFGRSFYILDDISALREINEDMLQDEAELFSVRDAWWYIPRSHLGFNTKKGSQGAAHYVADNPDFGALLTYYLPEDDSSLANNRKKREKELNEKNLDVPFIGYDSLLVESQEMKAQYEIQIKDDMGAVIRRIKAEGGKGFHRIAWDLRHAPVSLSGGGLNMLAAPGEYSAQLVRIHKGQEKPLGTEQTFMVKPLYESSIPAPDMEEKTAFWNEYRQLMKRYNHFNGEISELTEELSEVEKAMPLTPKITSEMRQSAHTVSKALQDLKTEVKGNPLRGEIGEKPRTRTIGDRMFDLYRVIAHSTYGPTPSAMKHLSIIQELLDENEPRLEELDDKIEELAEQIEENGGPWID